ncbi:MAG: hypothetical protein Q5537_03995, partial [Haemophilus parahaemolyticus]|nr:hypothetical protein [Haemophilus parahaemolyticus]
LTHTNCPRGLTIQRSSVFKRSEKLNKNEIKPKDKTSEACFELKKRRTKKREIQNIINRIFWRP